MDDNKQYSEKIFINTDEEIIFIVEKVLGSERNRIILVIPQYAILVSSLVNLKLLARQLLGIDKQVVLVTGSDLALRKSKDAGLISVEKAGDITEDTWKEAEEIIDTLRENREKLKRKLVEDRTEKKVSNNTPQEDIEEGDLKTAEDEVVLGDNQSDGQDDTIESNEKIKKRQEKERESKDQPFEYKPKVQKVGGFSVLGGANILKHEDYIGKEERREEVIVENKKKERDQVRLSNIRGEDPEEVDSNEASEMEAKKEDEESDTPVGSGGFKYHYTGRDFGKVSGNTQSRQRTQRKAIPVERPRSLSGSRVRDRSRRRGGHYNGQRTSSIPNIGFILRLKKLFFLILVVFFIYWLVGRASESMGRVYIEIKPSMEDVSVSERVSAEIDMTGIDIENKKIPLEKFEQTRGVSDTAEATGTANTGNLASGVVDFYNKSASEVTIPKGTRLVTLQNNLGFILQNSVTLPPRQSEITPSHYENAPILAESFGEQYNISGVDVKVEGYDTITQLSGRIYREAQGGTSTQIQVVSEEDANRVKGTLSESLKKLLISDMKKSLSGDFVFFEENVDFEEVEFNIAPGIGEKSEQFDVINYELKAHGFYVDQKSIDTLVEKLILSDLEKSSDIEVDYDSAAVVENPQRVGDRSFEFDISMQGEVRAEIDKKAITEKIKGLDMATARDFLERQEEVEEFSLKYSPFFIPGFFRSVPKEPSNIEIEVSV